MPVTKDKYCVIPLLRDTRTGRCGEGSRVEVTVGWGKGEGMGSHCLFGTEFVGRIKKTLEMGSGDGCPTL